MVNTSNCICPGLSVVSFQCSITGLGTTIWQGSAIESCGREIILTHQHFFGGAEGSHGECLDQTIVAYGLEPIHNTYISQLDVWISNALVNKTIECIYDDGTTEMTIGRAVLFINTGENLYYT